MGEYWCAIHILAMKIITEYFKYLLAFIILVGAQSSGELLLAEPHNAPDSTAVTVLFAGDIMQHTPQITAAKINDSTYDYTPVFKYVKPIISKFDLAVANLEVTLAGEPYTGYPQFSAPDELANAAKDAGFDVLCTANNHSCDRGDNGILRTVKTLKKTGIARTGTYTDSIDFRNNHPLMIHKNDITVALFNYTYGTNGLPFHYPAMVSLIDSSHLVSDLKAARRPGIDFIIVYFHWGQEYQSHPNHTQEELAQLAFNHGADVVIGSHPHVLQRMEYYAPSDTTNGQLVVYSLGNYVSNQRDRFRDGGAMISFTFSKNWNGHRVSNPKYHLTWVYTPMEDGRKQYYILPVTQFENDTTLDAASLSKIRLFSNDSRELFGNENRDVPEYPEKL